MFISRICPEQVKEELNDIPVQRYTSSHVRQNSLMSNPSSFGSNSTSESKLVEDSELYISFFNSFTLMEVDADPVVKTVN